MKKLSLLLLIVISVTACNNPENKIIGTWVTYDSYYGIMEIEFKKDFSLIINNYSELENFNNETSGYYTIIDNFLFITKEYETRDTVYNFTFLNDSLILAGGYENFIFKKLKKEKIDIALNKNKLIGQWKFPEYKYNIILTFQDNIVNIKEYDENLNIIGENSYPYEITERYIIFKEIDWENNNIKNFYRYYMYKNYLYNISKNRLILKGFNSENGLMKSMFLMKANN